MTGPSRSTRAPEDLDGPQGRPRRRVQPGPGRHGQPEGQDRRADALLLRLELQQAQPDGLIQAALKWTLGASKQVSELREKIETAEKEAKDNRATEHSEHVRLTQKYSQGIAHALAVMDAEGVPFADPVRTVRHGPKARDLRSPTSGSRTCSRRAPSWTSPPPPASSSSAGQLDEAELGSLPRCPCVRSGPPGSDGHGAVREVEHVHHPEHPRESRRDQERQTSDRTSIEDAREVLVPVILTDGTASAPAMYERVASRTRQERASIDSCGLRVCAAGARPR